MIGMVTYHCLILVTAFGAISAYLCNKEWANFGASCYYFGNNAVNWTTARGICKGFDGWLADIESKAENDWLRLHLTLEGAYHSWIGGTDLMKENSWRWQNSGRIIKLAGWSDNQPTGNTAANCLLTHQNYEHRWIDNPCKNKYHYVCEKHGESEPTKCQNKCCKTKCCH